MTRPGWSVALSSMTLACALGAATAMAQPRPSEGPVAHTVALDPGQDFALYELRDGALSLTVERRGDAWTQLAATSRAFSGDARLSSPRAPSATPDAVMTLAMLEAGGALTIGVTVDDVADDDGASALRVARVVSAGWIRGDGLSPTGFVTAVEAGDGRAVTVLLRRGDDGRWHRRTHDWGSTQNLPTLDDLDGDGVAEWIAPDDVFRQRAPSVEGALGPLGIWHVAGDRMEAVTWRFPAVVEDHRRWLASIEDSDLAAAAWVAETRLLGRAVRRDAVRAIAPSGDGEIFRRDLDGWMRRVHPLASRYVATHGPAARAARRR